MEATLRDRLLRAWILLLVVCVVAVVATDIFLPEGKPEQAAGEGKARFIDSPIELMPADTLRIMGQDSINHRLINITQYEGQHTKA